MRALEERIDPITMLKVAWCESRFKINAININKNKTIDIGVFQINSVHHKALNPYDYRENIEYAISLVKKRNWADFRASETCWKAPRPEIYQYLALDG